MNTIRCAVLTVSDTVSKDASLDKSGPVAREVLEGAGCTVTETTIVPDDIEAIQTIVRKWTGSGQLDWIITTGGTGFGRRDRTPEALSPLLDRHAPGLVHVIMATSLNKTPMAALSRPVAGTISTTLIVALPGSPRAVRECLDMLLANGLMFHAIDLNRGGTGKAVHQAMAKGASGPELAGVVSSTQTHHHSHSHHHHDHGHGHHAPKPRTVLSNDPSQPVSARARSSPYPLLELADALQLVHNQVATLEIVEMPVIPELAGYVLAEDVYADSDIPATPTTSVDGYALRSTNRPGKYSVLTPSTHPIAKELPEDRIYRINTGAPLPAGADTIIMVEDTVLSKSDADGEEVEVETLTQVPPGENVRAAGSDVRAGTRVLGVGDIMKSGGGELGSLAFIGKRHVKVYRKPVVAILSTGNELVDIGSAPTSSIDGAWGGIFDTNRPALSAAMKGMGYEVLDLGIMRDEKTAVEDALRRGINEADIVLTTGGTSMGVTDLLKPVLERSFDATIHFGRVAVKPGKPTTFATVPPPARKHSPVPIFALPGNPASALVTFYIFVVPALRKMGGWPDKQCALPRVSLRIQDPMALDPRPEFHRVIVKAGADGLKGYSTGGQRSSRVASLAGANGLVALPGRKEDGPKRLEKGEVAEAVIIGELEIY